MKENSFDALLIYILFFVVIIISLFNKRKKTKQDLAEFYSITRPTLAKWIEHFQIDFNPVEWKKKRTLSYFEDISLKNTFGKEVSLVLNKKQIVEMSASTYKVVAENVKNNVIKLGITLEAWECCSTFPPNVSQRILDMLEGKLAA